MRVRQGYHCIRSKRALVHSAAFRHRIDVEGGERPSGESMTGLPLPAAFAAPFSILLQI
jgi:hypothetical protein